MNATLIMSTCTADGLLLKPNKPMTAIDRSFSSSAPLGEVYSSYSNVSGFFWYYVLGADMQEQYNVYPEDLYPTPSNLTKCMAFNWNSPSELFIVGEDY